MQVTKLGNYHIDYTISSSTLNEYDLLQTFHDFLGQYYPNYQDTWQYDAAIAGLKVAKEGKLTFSINIPELVNETLPDMLSELAPIACFFGSHPGNISDIGFWALGGELDDFENSMDLDEIEALPYSYEGYAITSSEHSGHMPKCDKLDDFGAFLLDNADYAYSGSLLEERIDFIVENRFYFSDITYDAILDYITDSVFDCLLPEHYDFEYRLSDNGKHYGLYPELPRYEIVSGSKEEEETINLIAESSIFVKLLFLIRNKHTSKLMVSKASEKHLTELCYDVIQGKHFIPFYRVFNEAKAIIDRNEMNHAIVENNDAMNWTIETMFFDDFKSYVNENMGSDLTRLWVELMENNSDGMIDGTYLDEVYNLAETCSECEELERDSERYENKTCSCSDDYHAIWGINDSYMFKALKAHGAMVLETDSLYLYLQTDHSGTHYDSYLRKAYLSVCVYSTRSALLLNTVAQQ